jgi:hypothetical protein
MGLGSSPFARHYSGSRDFFPFLGLLRCFSSPACRARPMYSDERMRALPRMGFPIRRSRGQRMVSSSPGLFAAAHVLHRLLAPRHPPCALSFLIKRTPLLPLWSFQGARGRIPPARKTDHGPVSQNSTALNVEVDVFLGEPGHRTTISRDPHRRAGRPTGVMAPESLERR